MRNVHKPGVILKYYCISGHQKFKLYPKALPYMRCFFTIPLSPFICTRSTTASINNVHNSSKTSFKKKINVILNILPSYLTRCPQAFMLELKQIIVLYLFPTNISSFFLCLLLPSDLQPKSQRLTLAISVL